MARIFLDASALIPVVVPRDPWRGRLEARMRELAGERHSVMFTTNWTLYEALPQANRWGHRLAVDLFDWCRAQTTVAPVSFDMEAEALRRFLAWGDKTASVVDHANLLVAQQERCDAILSFDEDFAPLARSVGLRLLR